ncbi:MAG TPA: helical backbone metal receptor [Candidatus Acidoferrales bacterium]|nr:helical backbone metal receptor [Candidatus Acidoferrales bacterium]
MRKRLIVLAIVAVALCARTAFAIPAAQTDGKKPGRAVTDEVGRHMTVPTDVRRIVSLAPNLTEIVYALGAGDRLVGDTNACDTPPEAKSKPHVGNPQDPSLEAIVALHPDLVLATASINVPQTADTLLKLGVPVYTTYPHTVRQMLDSITEIGGLIGASPQGEALKTSLRARLDALQAKLGDRPLAHVLFLLSATPPIWSIGSNTFIADALRWAGAESVLVTDQNWPQPSFEEILRIQPDYIVVTADHEGDTSEASDLRSNLQWKNLMAVKLGRVVTVSDKFDRPSPGLVDAIEQLAHELHPEAFLPAVNQ